MVKRSVFDELLETLRFADAEKLLDEDDEALRAELAAQRDEAEERAHALFERTNQLKEERNLPELFEIARDPMTGSLLELLPETPRRRARMQLEEAELWVANRRETNARRMAEARRALEGLDLELARGLMNRIDGRFLTEEQIKERDQLLLDISARTMELESLSGTSDSPREETETDDQPWWRRWLG